MLSNERPRRYRLSIQTSKITDMFKQSTLGTLSSATTTSGYSTGNSSVSTNRNLSLKKSSLSSIAYNQEQHKAKSKGFNNILTKLKNLFIPSKTKQNNSKTMRKTLSRQLSSSNVFHQYQKHSTLYDVLPSSFAINNNTISLPFTYYQNLPLSESRTNFDKISAWLQHTEKMTNQKRNPNDLLLINANQQQPMFSTSVDKKGINVVMKKTSTNIEPPKRSSSLATRITRPIIEAQVQRTISPTSSFSSSILTKGMFESMTPPLSKSEKIENYLSKPNRRPIDISRRRTVATTNDNHSNKENYVKQHRKKSPQDIYRFSPTLENNKIEIHIPTSKNLSTKKYCFHSNSSNSTEDLLNNSYGLTLLKQQQQQPQTQPLKQRHSVPGVFIISQLSNNISPQNQYNPRTSIPHDQTVDSLDDLLCDREVESYFYPTSLQSDNIYSNYENSSYFHGTLC